MLSVTGLVAVLIACLGFGSNFVPAKKYETGNGLYYQLCMLSAVFIVACCVHTYRDFPKFYFFDAVGGMVWAVGNTLCIPVIQSIGMSLGLVMWSCSAMITGWATGMTGIFGNNPQDEVVTSWGLNIAGIVLATVASILAAFIKTDVNTMVLIKDTDTGAGAGVDTATATATGTNTNQSVGVNVNAKTETETERQIGTYCGDGELGKNEDTSYLFHLDNPLSNPHSNSLNISLKDHGDESHALLSNPNSNTSINSNPQLQHIQNPNSYQDEYLLSTNSNQPIRSNASNGSNISNISNNSSNNISNRSNQISASQSTGSHTSTTSNLSTNTSDPILDQLTTTIHPKHDTNSSFISTIVDIVTETDTIISGNALAFTNTDVYTQQDNDHPFYQYNDENNIHINSVSETKTCTKTHFRGVLLGLLTGVMFGANYNFVQRVMDTEPGASSDALDHVFGFFMGALFMTFSFFIIHAGIEFMRGKSPQIYPKVTFPSFLSGIIWVTAQISFFIANTELSQVITWPVIVVGPSVIATLWGICYFKEITGKKNYIIVCTFFIISIASAVVSLMSRL